MKTFVVKFILGCLIIVFFTQCKDHKKVYTIGNPILPGYFADPTIKKFGDTFYIYATTDNEMLASGAPTVWVSNDFKNWFNYIMDIPSLNSVSLRNFWAPDILKGNDGSYYLYFGNCQAGCNIYGYVSDTPVGPWQKLHDDDTPVISHNYPISGFPSLDAQFFKDDDGTIYAYWGTWVHYNSGYAVGILDNQTMDKVGNAKNIPIEQTPNPFEAAYLMKKGDDIHFNVFGGGRATMKPTKFFILMQTTRTGHLPPEKTIPFSKPILTEQFMDQGTILFFRTMTIIISFIINTIIRLLQVAYRDRYAWIA